MCKSVGSLAVNAIRRVVMKERDIGIDIIKFIASIIVVSIHTYLFKDISEVIYNMWLTIITGVAVPTFFVFSGYYLGRNIVYDDINKIKNTLIHFTKLYLIWGGWYAIWGILTKMIKGISFVYALKVNLLSFLIGSPQNAMWYLGTGLIGYFIIYIVLSRNTSVNRKKKIITILFVLFVIIHIFSFFWDDEKICGQYIYQIKTIYDSVIPNERIFPFKLIWLFWGVILGIKEKYIDNKIIKILFLIIGIIVCFTSYWESGISHTGVYSFFYQCFIMLWYMVFSNCLLMIGKKYKSSRVTRFPYGKLSICIFFLHIMIIDIWKIIVQIVFPTVVEFIIISFITLGISVGICRNKKMYKLLF